MQGRQTFSKLKHFNKLGVKEQFTMYKYYFLKLMYCYPNNNDKKTSLIY